MSGARKSESEYAEARKVLLDALEALGTHRSSSVDPQHVVRIRWIDFHVKSVPGLG